KYQDGMAVDRAPQRVDCCIVDRPADIGPADHGADMRMKRRDREGHGYLSVTNKWLWRRESARVPGLSMLGDRFVSLTIPAIQVGIASSAATKQSPPGPEPGRAAIGEMSPPVAVSHPFTPPTVDRLAVRRAGAAS